MSLVRCPPITVLAQSDVAPPQEEPDVSDEERLFGAAVSSSDEDPLGVSDTPSSAGFDRTTARPQRNTIGPLTCGNLGRASSSSSSSSAAQALSPDPHAFRTGCLAFVDEGRRSIEDLGAAETRIRRVDSHPLSSEVSFDALSAHDTIFSHPPGQTQEEPRIIFAADPDDLPIEEPPFEDPFVVNEGELGADLADGVAEEAGAGIEPDGDSYEARLAIARQRCGISTSQVRRGQRQPLRIRQRSKRPPRVVLPDAPPLGRLGRATATELPEMVARLQRGRSDKVVLEEQGPSRPPLAKVTLPGDVLQLQFLNVSYMSRPVEEYLRTRPVHALAVAEHRLEHGAFKGVKKRCWHAGWRTHANTAVSTGDGVLATSCGEALMFRKHLVTRHLGQHPAFPQDQIPTTRILVSLLALAQITLAVVVVYFETGLGVEGTNIQLLIHLQLLIQILGLPAVVIGDFNFTPTELRDSGWLERLGLSLLVPRDALYTCRGGTQRLLDYGLASPIVCHMHRGTELVREVPCYPHFGVLFSFASQLSEIWIHTLIQAPRFVRQKVDLKELEAQPQGEWSTSVDNAASRAGQRPPASLDIVPSSALYADVQEPAADLSRRVVEWSAAACFHVRSLWEQDTKDLQ